MGWRWYGYWLKHVGGGVLAFLLLSTVLGAMLGGAQEFIVAETRYWIKHVVYVLSMTGFIAHLGLRVRARRRLTPDAKAIPGGFGIVLRGFYLFVLFAITAGGLTGVAKGLQLERTLTDLVILIWFAAGVVIGIWYIVYALRVRKADAS